MKLHCIRMRYLYFNSYGNTLLMKTVFLRVRNFSIKSWSIVFFGNDNFSLVSLEALHKQMKQLNISNLEVVMTNEKNYVYKYSASNNIKIHFWPPTLNGSYDFGIIVSFGKLIPKEVTELFTLGILNVHASLLPKYRGGMPMVHAVKNGENVTGVTVTKISPDKFDVGEIILQKTCSIGKNELMPSLYNRLSHLGCECLLEVIKSMPKCLKSSFPQSHEEASYAPKLKKEVAVVRWNDKTALEIFNLHRALFGMYELISTFRGEQVNFVCMFLSDSDSPPSKDKTGIKSEPGSFTYCKKTRFLYVQCKDKTVTVCTIKYRGKMYRSSSFHAGYLHNLLKTQWKFES